MALSHADAVAARAAAQFDETVHQLSAYLTVPAISCDTAHFEDVRTLAAQIRGDLDALGMDNARVLELDDALPCVAAEWLKAGPDAPTVLIYGHLDLQPVKGEPWTTAPHEAVIKDGRLFARGSADDMGGWVSHMAAMRAWLEETGTLPVNVRLLIEGEEEIGSPNLERFMDAYPDAFDADVMVLTDCENPSVDIPGLTVSLRGLFECDIAVSALKSDVHSGLWGNAAPDAHMALIKLLARFVDDNGRMVLGRQEVPADWAKASYDVPLDADTVVTGAGLVDGVMPLPLDGKSYAEWLWRQPAVTILSTSMPRPDQNKNALRAGATATLSIRLAPGQTAADMEALVRGALENPPGGVNVELTVRPGGASSWLYEPKGPAFPAADRAYEKAWGRPLLQVGIGGSIPFVALFGQRFGDLPLILNGVLDPESGAHGPDESMHLGVFKKAIAANVHLLAELAATPGLKRG